MNKGLAIVIVIIFIIGVVFVFRSTNNTMKENNTDINIQSEGDIQVVPIEHATMVLKWAGKVIYTDPTGGAEAFAGEPVPDLILITDIHGDHLDRVTLLVVVKENTIVVMPQAVADELEEKLPGVTVILKNGEKTNQAGFLIEAIPMYNLPEKIDAYHTKGRGNGYVLEATGKRVYISGDTAGIPEMRSLKNIDFAFVSMNLPFTMDVEEAADAVLEFKPKVVTPYHYRGQNGLSDTKKFRDLVNALDPNITVDLMDFYPEESN